jgi:hypothetical protein
MRNPHLPEEFDSPFHGLFQRDLGFMGTNHFHDLLPHGKEGVETSHGFLEYDGKILSPQGVHLVLGDPGKV